MLVDFLVGVLSGTVGLSGLLLCNGLLAMGWAWTGEALAILVAVAMAALGGSARTGRTGAAAWGAVACTGALGWLLAGPNPSLEGGEYALDRYVLLPRMAQLLHGPPAWEFGFTTAIPIFGATLVGAGLAYAFAQRRQLLARLLLAGMVVSFLAAAANMNPGVYRDTERPPVPHEYVVDGFLWLRMHDLMQQGKGYYPGFYTAYVERKGETATPGNWLNWRPPVLFYLWMLVPGGPRGLLFLFWGLAAATLVASFALIREYADEGLALWPPALLGAYYLYGADTIWYTSQEWWGSFFMIFGMWAWTRRKPFLGAGFWALACTSREHFCYLMPMLLLLSMLGGRREKLAAAGAIAFVTVVFLVHYSQVAPYVVPANTGLKAWSQAGADFIYSSLHFSSVYLAGRDYLLIPLYLLGGAGALLVRDRSSQVMFAFSIFAPLFVYYFIGSPERIYWGVVLAPQMLLCVPLVCNRLAGLGGPLGEESNPPAYGP